MAWRFDVNEDSLIQNFALELGKASSSKGNFIDDYRGFAEDFKIVPCPFVSFRGKGSIQMGELYVGNCAIDLCSWRIALLAVNCGNISCIHLHNVALSVQCVLDLAATVNKLGSMKFIKLEYCSFQCNSNEAPAALGDALKSLLGCQANVDYFSFRGSALGDELISQCLPAMQGNGSILALNLSANCLSDDGVAAVLRMLRLSVSITSINLSANSAGDKSLNVLRLLLVGEESTADDQQTYKKQLAAVGERNKAIKAVNKKRKKSGEEELPELPTPDRIFTVDGKSLVIHKNLCAVDLTKNRDISVAALTSLADTLFSTCWTSYSPITLLFRGLVEGVDAKNRVSAGSSPQGVSFIL